MDAIKDLFRRNKAATPAKKPAESQAALSEVALRAIHDGVIIVDKNDTIQFINPAAVTMTESGSPDHVIGLDCSLVVKLQSKDGRELPEQENPFIRSIKSNQPLEAYQAILVPGKTGKNFPVSLSVLPAEGFSQNRVITFRNITKELEEEGEQTEFISTASHEMRTPVATIDGYLSLTLNPQTATIDERARGYLTAAQAAAKHLGKLFQDLLDVTKLDDGRIRPHLEPVEMVSFVKKVSDDYLERIKDGKLNFRFGSSDPNFSDGGRHLDQLVYGYVDVNFMREILDNLIENAIKYTPEGGSIYINARGDGDRALINVTDTGIGISAEDLGHIFQKFYRADNSDTREVGGTGLGLYLVKQRVEAMGGRVWAESGFGEGSTFFVSLPRITQSEYEKRMIAANNQQLQPQPAMPAAPQPAPAAPVAPTPIAPAHTPTAPAPTPVAPAHTPTAPAPTPVAPASAPAPVAAPAASPVAAPATPTTSSTQATPPAPVVYPTAPAPPAPPAPPSPTPATVPTSPPPQKFNNNLNGEAK